MEQFLTICKERVKHTFSGHLYQLRQTLVDKLDSLKIPSSEDQTLSKNTAIFDFEQNCAQEEKVPGTDTTTWIDKHVPKTVSIFSKVIEQPIFLCNSNSGALVESITDALDGLAIQSKTQMKIKFLEIQTSVESKLNQIFPALN